MVTSNLEPLKINHMLIRFYTYEINNNKRNENHNNKVNLYCCYRFQYYLQQQKASTNQF